jgi:hypothetical protein
MKGTEGGGSQPLILSATHLVMWLSVRHPASAMAVWSSLRRSPSTRPTPASPPTARPKNTGDSQRPGYGLSENDYEAGIKVAVPL